MQDPAGGLRSDRRQFMSGRVSLLSCTLSTGVSQMTDNKLTSIETAKRCLSLGLEAVAMVSFMIMCISVILQVVFRYVLQLVAPWTEELARFACIWSVFFGAAVCFDERAHITIDFIINKVSRKVTRRLLLLINTFVTSTFVLIAFYGSILLVRIGWADIATTVPIQMGLVYLALPISLGAIAIFGVLRFFVAARGGKGQAEVIGESSSS
jgi:TRAP-type C4-dicarboxylate transport system permease small subunit